MNMAATEQSTLLDLDSKEFNIMFVDESQPLQVFQNPLHWKAHKLQVALQRMDRMAQTNPAQFNSTVYMSMLDKLTELMQDINNAEKVAKANEILDAGNVATSGNATAAPAHSDIEPISMDS